MAIVKLWTATRTTTPSRFHEEDSVVWAGPAGVHYRTYGGYVWELEVEIPENCRGRYMVHEHDADEGWAWGCSVSEPHHSGAYCFLAGAIVSRRLLSNEEIEEGKKAFQSTVPYSYAAWGRIPSVTVLEAVGDWHPAEDIYPIAQGLTCVKKRKRFEWVDW